MVGHLAAHLGVEGRFVQHHNGLATADDLIPLLALGHNGHHLGIQHGIIPVAHKLGLWHILTKFHAGPAQIAQSLPGLPGPLALLLHELVEGVLVQGHALLLHHLQRQVDREAVGII